MKRGLAEGDVVGGFAHEDVGVKAVAGELGFAGCLGPYLIGKHEHDHGEWQLHIEFPLTLPTVNNIIIT